MWHKVTLGGHNKENSELFLLVHVCVTHRARIIGLQQFKEKKGSHAEGDDTRREEKPRLHNCIAIL
jgi:hypothetical protein